MIIFKSIDELNKKIKFTRNIGFVPTMGALHKGHVSLINKSKIKSNKTLVSIFVNPKQFNNKKDYLKYPRNISRDIKLLKKHKVDYVLIPRYKDIYKSNYKFHIEIPNILKVMCAKYRPGHFEGVLNIINIFLSKIRLKYIFLGEKDYQQLFLIKRFVKNRYKTKVIACKTIRHGNLRPYSSRNNLLQKRDLKKLDEISKILKKFKSDLKTKKKGIDELRLIKSKIKENKVKIEYLEIRNKNSLKKIFSKNNLKIFIAYYIKKVRIIDNFWLIIKKESTYT